MKKILYLVICMMLFCCACSALESGLNPITQAKQRITMTFRCEDMAQTRAEPDDSRIDDINLYMFPANGGPAHHVYIDPIQSVVLELPKGDYTLYAVANLGWDTGDQTQEYVRMLRFEQHPDQFAGGALPMSAEQEVIIRGETRINVSLVRTVAKVNFSYSVENLFAGVLKVKSVQLRSVARSIAFFNTSHAHAISDVTDFEPIATSGATFSATYYLPENQQGVNASISEQQLKNETNAPDFATYIAIEGEVNGVNVFYRIYLGENNTTDFNIVRNRVYNINAHILGMNTVDWRVSTTELSIMPFAEVCIPGQVVRSQLRLVSSNTDENQYYLSCIQEAGDGEVTVGGQFYNPSTSYPFFSGSGTTTAEITYIQPYTGDVRLRFNLTDRYGLCIERVLETRYIDQPLTITCSQEGKDLTLRDRATLNYTITQGGYSGPYTVKIEGTPSLFQDTHEITPATQFTVPGNGTYSLRIRPEAVGDNPYKITVTDANGNSGEYKSSVTGIPMYSHFTLDFSKGSTGYLNLMVKCSYPPLENVSVIVKPTVNVISSGGKITTQTYTMNMIIPSGENSGMGSIRLILGNSYLDYFVASATASFSPASSHNGLLQYTLQSE